MRIVFFPLITHAFYNIIEFLSAKLDIFLAIKFYSDVDGIQDIFEPSWQTLEIDSPAERQREKFIYRKHYSFQSIELPNMLLHSQLVLLYYILITT